MTTLGDITQKRGDTGDITFTFKKDGVAYDLHGCTVIFTVRKKIPATSISTDLDTDVVIGPKVIEIADDDETGVIFVEISKSETNIDCKTYYYDIQVETPPSSGALEDRSNWKKRSSGVYRYIISNDIVRS